MKYSGPLYGAGLVASTDGDLWLYGGYGPSDVAVYGELRKRYKLKKRNRKIDRENKLTFVQTGHITRIRIWVTYGDSLLTIKFGFGKEAFLLMLPSIQS